MGDGSSKLHLSEEILQEMRTLCEAAYPHEACGLLVGEMEPKRRIRRIHPARNLNRERPHDRYLVDPADFVAADASGRAEGQGVVGVYHSHPDLPDSPSPTDLADAQPGWSYVIVSVHGEGSKGRAASQRSWIVREGAGFVEERLCVC